MRGVHITTRVQAFDKHDAQRAGVQVNTFGDSGYAANYGLATTTNIWMERDLGDGWTAAYRFVLDPRGALVVAELRIYPREKGWSEGEWSGTIVGIHAHTVPPGGLSTTIARRAKVAEHLADAQRVVNWAEVKTALARRHGLTRPDDPYGPTALWGQLGVQRQVLRSRNGALARYARAAQVYVEAIAARDRTPLATVARRLRVPYATARNMIREARQRDLLLPKQATRGRADGRLTDLARQILKKKTRRT